MKKFLRFIALALVSVMAFAAVGCGNPDEPVGGEENGSLVIRPFGGGYGTTWLTAIAKQFSKDTGIAVDVKPAVTDTGSWESEIDAGTSTVDLYFDNTSGLAYSSKSGLTVKGVKYNTYLADLTDMYNTKVPGEDVLYKDKMFSKLEQAYNFDYVYDAETGEYSNLSETGKYYVTSWGGGTVGLVVNMEKWDSAYGDLPNTTDELLALCERILSANASKPVTTKEYPFIYSLKSSYWKFLFETWAFQYMGEEGYNDYVNGYDSKGERYTKDLLRYQGFLESLDIIEDCLVPRGSDGKSGYSHPTSTAVTFTEAQFKLLNVGGGIMQPNGNWLISEMAANYKNAKTMNVKFMKTPVVSSIIDVLPDKSVANDAELSALIAAIDAGVKELKGDGYEVTQNDYDYVAWARGYVTMSVSAQGAFIPAYAKNAENAKKFLLYLAKDSSLEIYYKETMGSTMPFTYDYSESTYEPSVFIKSEQELLASCTAMPLVIGCSKYAFFNRTGFNPFNMPYATQNDTETYFSAPNEVDRKTAAEVFDANYKYAADNWNISYAPYAWGD